MSAKHNQIVIIEVENKPGVLNKVASLCRRRRYNIQGLTVGPTHKEGVSQITLEFQHEKERIYQIAKQINKLIEVLNIEVVESKNVIDKEMVLMIVKNKKVVKKLQNQSTHNISIKILTTINDQIVIEITGEGTRVEHVLATLNFKNEVVKMVRSGLMALKL